MKQNSRRHSSLTLLAGIVVGGVIGVWSAYAMISSRPGSPQPDLRESAERGHDIAVLVCSRCHAVTATAKSPNPQAPPFSALISKLSKEGLLEQLEVGLSLGHRPMPPWQFSTEQADDLLTYMASLQAE